MTSKDIVVQSWAATHVAEFEDHEVQESKNSPPECNTCGAKSPAWDLHADAQMLGYMVHLDITKTVIVPTYGFDIESISKKAFFEILEPGMSVTDIRLFPSNLCIHCLAVSDEKIHAEGEEDCPGDWVRDSTYDI